MSTSRRTPLRTFALPAACALLLAYPGRAQTPSEAEAAPDLGPRTASVRAWKPLFCGVDHASASAERPRPLRVHAVRIDLAGAGIRFLVTPSNGERPLDTDGMRTSTFLERFGCQVAINASPFSPIVPREGAPQDVLGLSISQGDEYSPAGEAYGALLIDRGNRARIAAPPIDTRGAHNAVGGFRLLLVEGRNVGAGGPVHPRSAAGVSGDGRYLYLVAIDGRQPGVSEGATTAETAEWLRRFGAGDALNLDGGGSTSLVVDGGSGEAAILNSPIHLGIPGQERVNANHLGVYARRL